MDNEEDIARPKDWTQREIENLSIEHLADYIAELRVEIARVEANLAAKKSHANDAESLFKKQRFLNNNLAKNSQIQIISNQILRIFY